MPADFPVPRSEIPKLEVSQDEYLARKLQMDNMVERLVQEYEEYSEVNKRHINTRRWKQVGSRERCKLYRERPKYQTAAGALGTYGQMNRKYSTAPSSYSSGEGSGSWHDDDCMSENSYGGPMSTRSSNDSYGSTGRTRVATARSRGVSSSVASGPAPKLDPQTNAQEIADTMPKMLMIGERPGRLEDAMHSLVARNHEELAFVVVFLHKEVADCAILHTMEAPTEEEPYRWLGYKWFVKPSPATAISKLVKNRDNIYLEYTGVTTTSTGEVVGFHIMHSIDVDGFPDFHDRNCVRTSISTLSIYHQTEENMVEFFMMGNVDIGGTVGASPFKSIFIADTMFGMPRAIDAGESKRLTQLVLERRRARAASGRTKLAPLCRLCRSERKSYNMVSLVLCEICGHTVCTRCRVHKEVFESDGILGRFNKFDCCKTCVVDIAETHLPPAKAQASLRQKRAPSIAPSVHSALSSQRSRNWTATSAPLYEDEVDEHHDDDATLRAMRQQRAHRDHRSKLSVASTLTTSTASSDGGSQRTMAPFNTSIDSRDSTISDISEFDRSFAIIKNTANPEHLQRETTGRETEFSIDDYDDDWQPEFAKSQIGAFNKSQIQDNFARSQVPPGHQNDMVLYNKNAADQQQYRSRSNSRQRGQHYDSHLAMVPITRSGSGGSRRQDTNYAAHPTQLRMHNSRMNDNMGPPNLQRKQSGGSDYSRDDLINRMQHLAQLAEATYNTTQHNQNMFNHAQQSRQQQSQQPIENRNRFFYY